MRIIAGLAKGRRLFAPKGESTRPTTDRVRESLFSILASRVENANVLDLFAGSGALSLEALSRGARFAYLNDFSRSAVSAIERNVALAGFGDRCRVMCRDWKSAVESLRQEKFSLVFLDPPYSKREFYPQVAAALHALRLLDDDAVIVMERLSKDVLELPEGFEAYDERRYGDTTISLVRRVPGI